MLVLGLTLVAGQAQAAETAAATAATAEAATTAGDDENADFGTRVSELVVSASRPAAVAPTSASLEAIEPQSIISRSAIDAFVPNSADYTQVVLISPSAAGIAINGPGFSEAKTTLRGFQDGEYNITYDGIPWGDTNGPTHHSTSFFPSSTIGAVVVDRGPGAAGQLGQATFGGSINLFSPEVGREFGGYQLFTAGSWNSWMSVTKLNTGEIPQLGNARLLMNFQELRTDGALTYSGATATNQLLRGVIPLNPNWNLTLLGAFNQTKVFQNDSNGATLAQVALYGQKFGNSNDPNSANYFGYNRVSKRTDFDYARLNGVVGDMMTVENTLYTYHYKNDTETALDATITPAQTAALTVTLTPGGAKTKGMPAYTKLNEYRVYGDSLRADFDVSIAKIRSGLWWEYADTGPRARVDYDAFSAQYDYRQAALGTTPRYLEYLQYSGWTQWEPFVDLALKLSDKLTVTPGVKYVHFDLSVDSDVNQKTRTPLHASHTFEKTLYYLTANYKLRDNLAIYGQFATGFLVPDISVFQVPNPNVTDLKPQESKNYQAGIVYHGDKISIDIDYYYIDFTNKQSSTLIAGETVFSNIGGAVYKGFEGQVSYLLTDQLSLFANGSANSAKSSTTGFQIKGAPTSTAAYGLLFRNDKWTASFADKYTGKQWGIEGEPAAYEIAGYDSAEAKVSRVIGKAKLEVAVYNVFDKTPVVNLKQGKTVPFDQYYFQPTRNYQVSLKVNF